MFKKITIIKIRTKPRDDINQELLLFCNSLGIIGERDKDKSCYRIFLELLKSIKKNSVMSSDELAEKLELTRGTVVHHLNRLIEAGIVVREDNKYILRMNDLKSLVDEIKIDIENNIKQLKQVAEDIDEQLGI